MMRLVWSKSAGYWNSYDFSNDTYIKYDNQTVSDVAESLGLWQGYDLAECTGAF